MKKPALAEHHANMREQRNRNIQLKYGEVVIDMIGNGKTIGDIANAIGKGPIPTRNYLKWCGLYKDAAENWDSKKKLIAKQNGKLSANTLSGVHLKQLTTEIKDWFLEQVNAGQYKWDIKRDLKVKFGYGEKKYYQLCKEVRMPADNPQTGELNPMYGRSPGKYSGIGVKGWVYINGTKLFFRSSLELKVYLYLEKANIPFVQSAHRILYVDGGKNRTYCPDIVIGNTIYEIKPSKMVGIVSVVKKFEALQEYCTKYGLSCGFITESTYSLNSPVKSQIDEWMEKKKIIMDKKNYDKLMRYL